MCHYTADERRAEHEAILHEPERESGFDARTIFWLEDRVWGTDRTLGKFKARELVARSPYRAWEALDDPTAAAETANERAHWNVLVGLMHEDGVTEHVLRYGLVPAFGAIVMFAYMLLMVRLLPGRSYRLNADIEDHAMHEYAAFVAEHPEWEARPYNNYNNNTLGYGLYASRNDVLRQIGLDEREHRQRSIERLAMHNRARLGRTTAKRITSRH